MIGINVIFQFYARINIAFKSSYFWIGVTFWRYVTVQEELTVLNTQEKWKSYM